ncbi:MAG TPA: aminoglycoside phosphotransferase family protein [Iamia sp.]
MPNRMHPDQLDVDVDLVRRLIASQHPRWSGLPIVEVPSVGTVNAVYRLGEDLCVRLPLLPGWGRSLEHEVEWLPWLAARLPVAVPEPVAVGRPDDGYPNPWAVLRWLPGSTAEHTPRGGEALADDLAATITALAALDPTGAPRAENRWALRHLDPSIRAGLDQLDDEIDVSRTTEAWDAALAAPAFDGPPTWVHGDLLAANLLVADGRLTGVLDWGGSGTGDPAADLYPAWAVLDEVGRERFRTTLDVDDDAWARGRGWALRTPIQGLPYYRTTNPGFVDMVRQVLDTVLWGAVGETG